MSVNSRFLLCLLILSCMAGSSVFIFKNKHHIFFSTQDCNYLQYSIPWAQNTSGAWSLPGPKSQALKVDEINNYWHTTLCFLKVFFIYLLSPLGTAFSSFLPFLVAGCLSHSVMSLHILEAKLCVLLMNLECWTEKTCMVKMIALVSNNQENDKCKFSWRNLHINAEFSVRVICLWLQIAAEDLWLSKAVEGRYCSLATSTDKLVPHTVHQQMFNWSSFLCCFFVQGVGQFRIVVGN